MRWTFFTQSQIRDAGRRFRAEHSAFLTRALCRPGSAYPRIPTRRVDRGGFDRQRELASQNPSEDRFDKWWNLAMQKVER